MRYFWHALIAIGTIALVIFVFFVFSLRTGHRITFTDDTALTAPTVTIADPSTGPDSAAVTIVNFGDYQCESCARMDEAIVDIMAEFPEQIRLVWKDMPNTSLHEEALNAAVAARCAAKQDAFFAYHSYLFANQSLLGKELYTGIAEELGLKDRSFQQCYEDQETLPLVQKSYEEGIALQITATPTIFVNGERYTGALSTSALRSAITPFLSTP